MPRRKAEPAEVAVVEEKDARALILTRLLKGGTPANRDEAFLGLRWQALTRDQQKALAAEWDLPDEQKPDSRLTKQAIDELS